MNCPGCETEIRFTVPAIPVAQPRHRIGMVNGKARAFGAKKSHPVHAFKATVRVAAQNAYDGPPLSGPLRCDIVFVLPRTKGQLWKTKPMPRLPHAKKPDADNLAKSVYDALTGLLWIDDAQICLSSLTKVIACGDEQPHVVITLSTF